MSNDNVLIVVSIDITTGNTTFLRSYISKDPFTKIESLNGQFKGFNIPSSAVYKNINDNCQTSGLGSGCITIADEDEFPQLINYEKNKYGFIITSTTNPEKIEMCTLDVTGEQLITSDESKITTEAFIVPYERAQVTSQANTALDGVLGLFAPSPSASSSSSVPPSAPTAQTGYVKTTDKVWIRKAMDNMADGMEVNKDKVYEYKETKKDTTGTTFYHVYDKGAEVGWLPEGINGKQYVEIISVEEASKVLNIPPDTSASLSSEQQSSTGNLSNVKDGFIKITRYQGLFNKPKDEMFLTAGFGAGAEEDFNNKSKVYHFNDYTQIKENDREVDIYQVDLPNGDKNLWIKGTAYDINGNSGKITKVITASVISKEEADQLIAAEKSALDQSAPPSTATVDPNLIPQTGKLRLLSGEPKLWSKHGKGFAMIGTSTYDALDEAVYTDYFKDDNEDEWFNIKGKNDSRDAWIKGSDIGALTGKKRKVVEIINEAADASQSPSGASQSPSGASQSQPDASQSQPDASKSLLSPVIGSETKMSTAANVIEFNREIDRLLRSDSSAANVQPGTNALSAAIKAVGVAAAAAASAIGKIQPKPSDDLASAVSDAAGKTFASVSGSLMDVLAPDNKSELSKAISAAAKAAADAATAVGKLSAPMDQTEIPQPSQPQADAAADRIAAEKIAAEKLAADEQRVAAEKLAADEQRVAAEKLAADKLAADKIAADKLAADKIAADEQRVAAEKLAADEQRVAAEKLATEKAAVEQAMKEKAAKEKAKSDLVKSVSVVATSISGAVNAIQSLVKEAAPEAAVLSAPEEEVDEGIDELGLKTETPESIQGIIKGLTPFILKNDFEVNVNGLTDDAKTIIGAKQSGGGYLGDNRSVIDKANEYINTFKAETSKLLSNPIVLKLTSLSTDQLSNIIKEPIFARSREGGNNLSVIEKKTMLSCIVNFLYSDFTFFVLFNENMQKLLFEKTFDMYQKLGPIKNNRNNYFALIDEKERKKENNMYEGFVGLIKTKNETINEDLKKSNTYLQKLYIQNGGKYKYVGFNNSEQIDNQIQIRVGELTIYIKEFLGLLTKFQENIANVISTSKKGQDELPRGSYDLYDMLIKYIKGKKEQLDQLNTTIIPIVEINTKVFKTKLEDEISNNSTNNIITYLKLRNDDHGRGIYNKRFNILKHKENNSLLVQYRDDNFEFHDAKTIDRFNSLLLDKIEKSGGEYDGIKLTDDALDITTYKHNYLFGKFTDIFLPADSNEAIAGKMKTIHDKIISGFPVFMLGYGASGAGKTSSLVYFNGGKEGEKDGILIHLCNKLSNDFDELEMCSREFFHVKAKKIGEQKKLNNPDIFYTPQQPNDRITFMLDENSRFVLKEPYSHVNHHQYKVLTDGADEGKKDIIANVGADGSISYTDKEGGDLGSEEPENALITKHVFAKGTSLGAVAIHLIDTDRFVKATTNNPNSSRSHTLIFVRLKRKSGSNGSDGNIIIGDFAGVENAFACEDPLTIGKFLSVLRDPKGDKPQFPYYSTEAYNGDPDPYGTLTGGTISATCKPLISAKESIYDFTKPVIRKSWIGLREGVSRYCDSNKVNFKYAIDIIRNYVGTDVLKDYEETNVTAAYSGNKIPDFINEFGIYSGNEGLIANQKTIIKTRMDVLVKYRTVVGKYSSTISAPTIPAKLQGIANYYTATHDSTITARDKLTVDTLESISKKYQNSDAAPVSVLNSIFGSFKIAISKVDEINKLIAQQTFVKPIPPITNQVLLDVFTTSKTYDGSIWANLSKINSDKQKELTNVIIKNLTELTTQLQNMDSINKANATKFDKILQAVGVNRDAKKIAAEIYTNIISDEKFVEYIRDAEVEKACREGNSDVICQNRREEGMFINDSLAKVRGVISEILYEKNKDKVNISPEFIDECLGKYCSSDEGCFRFDRLTDASSVTTGSVIFDEIYKVLNDDNKYTSVQDLYKVIIVGVFCVFNISRKANNPPPTPYMDINDLKRRFSSGILDADAYEEFQRLGIKIIEMIENTRDATTVDNPTWFGDKVANLKSISSKAGLGKNSTLPALYNANADVPKTIFAEFKYILNSLLSKLKTNYTRVNMYKERIEDFINMVDNSNATSAIGTLDFLDKISKYNTVNMTCNTDDPNGFLPIGQAQAERGFEGIQLEYVEIYSSNGGGTKRNSRNTKRHKPKPKKKQTTTLKSYSR
jgi:hypothetical protein